MMMTGQETKQAGAKATVRLGKGGAAAAAAIVGAMAAAVVPVAVWESISASYGIAELIPAAAPPLGNTARLLFILVGALVAAAAVLAFWPEKPISYKEQGFDMQNASVSTNTQKNFGPDILKMVNQSKSSLLERLRSMRFGKPDTVGQKGQVPSHRRADLHPDAPIRSPIMASRDFKNVPNDVDEAVIAGAQRIRPVADVATPFDDGSSERGYGEIARGEQAFLQTPKVPPLQNAQPSTENIPTFTSPVQADALGEPVVHPVDSGSEPVTAKQEDPFSGLTLDQLVNRLSSALDQRSSNPASEAPTAERAAKLNARADEMDDALKAALATLQEMNVRRA